jgi:RNA 3'-phosphate cyclase
MIEIDGSQGEGGGQILRSSLALAAVLGKDVRVLNIRAGRSEPGLRAQHLTGAKAVASLCNANFEGLEIGSSEFIFRPGKIREGAFRFDVGTAGSVTLVLQALMPLLPFSSGKTSLEICGGTDVKWSPPVDYLSLVALPLLKKMGVEVSLQVDKRGYYPRGGGVVKAYSAPTGFLKPIQGLNSGRVSSIIGISHATGLPMHVAQRQASAAVRLIEKKGLFHPRIEIENLESSTQSGPGSGIVLSATMENSSILGGDCLGERGKSAEEVGRVAAQTLIEEVESGCFLDRHLGDMIIPYLSLAEGVSELSISQVTQHTLTNVKVAEMIAGVHFDLLEKLGSQSTLRVKGLGLRRPQDGASPRESRLIANS